MVLIATMPLESDATILKFHETIPNIRCHHLYHQCTVLGTICSCPTVDRNNYCIGEYSSDATCITGVEKRKQISKVACDKFDKLTPCGSNSYCQHVVKPDVQTGCTCQNGYVEDPKYAANRAGGAINALCTDFNECEYPNTYPACGASQDCTNTVGSFTCDCKSGFLENSDPNELYWFKDKACVECKGVGATEYKGQCTCSGDPNASLVDISTCVCNEKFQEFQGTCVAMTKSGRRKAISGRRDTKNGRRKNSINL